MNHGTKNKLLTVLVVLLLIANAATLALFWMGKAKHPPQPKGTPQEFLVKELKLDVQQQEQLDVLRKEHREAADQLREKIKEAKEAFFDLLKQTNVTDSAKQAAAKAISSNTEALDLMTLSHFQKLRSLCTPEQQNKFDEIIHEVASRISQPRPPGRPRGRDRPPPPQN
ncbi:MAG: periplasmic heavy metal sensor [Chitinophagaceae bacterium]|nr:periplasmic heavy metal sensor [Chitinophagaceae bacterium]